MPRASFNYPIKREIWGVVLLLLTLIVAVSLFSYNPQDQLLWEKPHVVGEPKNLFGPIGSHLAGSLFLVLGFSSFWLIPILVYLAACFFRGKFPSGPIWIGASLILLILSFSALISLYVPKGVPYRGTLMSGGVAGLYCAWLGKKVLNSFGACALFLTVFVISFMIITRFSFGKLANLIWSAFSRIAMFIKEKWLKYHERRKRAKTRKTTAEKIVRGRERKPTIVEAPKQKPPKPTQEFFPFMSLPGKFKLPPLDLLDEAPRQPDGGVQKESLRMNALRFEATFPYQPPGEDGDAWGAQILISGDGRHLYTSERNSSTIQAHAIDPETGALVLLGVWGVEACPRNFALSADGGWLVVAGEKSDTIAAHALDRDSGKVSVPPASRLVTGAGPVWVAMLAREVFDEAS